MYEEMKKKFEAGDYICVMATGSISDWDIVSTPTFSHRNEFKLIHKKDKDILYAFLKGEEIFVKVVGRKSFKNCKDFICTYNHRNTYCLDTKLTNEDKEEISEQIDNINEAIESLKFKVVNSAILVGNGKDIANNIGNHLNKNYEYEIIIKQIQP